MKISIMEKQTAINTEQIIEDLRTAIEFVERRVINRTDVIEQIICALLTREHALIQSRTGAGKSLLAGQIFAMFEGAHVFKVQASKEQQPDTYFGGLDLEELKRGRLIHNIEGSLVDSEFGFIDEIFDANDYTLRALLTALNERALSRGVQHVMAKIHSVIAATNYLRVSEVTEAVLDRFLYKSLIFPDKVPLVQYQISQTYLEHGGNAIYPKKRFPYSTLLTVTRIIKGEDEKMQIAIAPEIIFFANLVIRYYEMQRNRLIHEKPHEHAQQKDYYISPRTQTKALDLLRAVAFLQGRDHVVKEDVKKLWYLFCTVGIAEQKALFKKSYETLLHQYDASKGLEKLKSLLDLQELLDKLNANPSLLKKPITEIEDIVVKRSLVEWAKETLGITDANAEHNRRMLEGYLKSIIPVTEEIKELKQRQEAEVKELFQPIEHIWGS